ncbi:hypothetical protein SVAN01_10645 [Stagonosporopsis vannaccii]|nr:hypothetical protein SVAN01_10645 [Stagonosporopsis vannaccii]
MAPLTGTAAEALFGRQNICKFAFAETERELDQVTSVANDGTSRRCRPLAIGPSLEACSTRAEDPPSSNRRVLSTSDGCVLFAIRRHTSVFPSEHKNISADYSRFRGVESRATAVVAYCTEAPSRKFRTAAHAGGPYYIMTI